jgi:CheY-like chemotaxis protein
LLVEDQPQLRMVVKSALEDGGYEVLEARDADEALLLADDTRHQIAAVVTDVVMPRMGGPELVARLVRARPRLKVRYLSGYADDEGLRREIDERRAGFVAKPFTAGELLGAVREVLDRAMPDEE